MRRISNVEAPIRNTPVVELTRGHFIAHAELLWLGIRYLAFHEKPAADPIAGALSYPGCERINGGIQMCQIMLGIGGLCFTRLDPSVNLGRF